MERKQPCILPRPCPKEGNCGYYHSPEQMQRWKKEASGDPCGKPSKTTKKKKQRRKSVKSDGGSHSVKPHTDILASHSVMCDTILFVIQQDRDTQHDWTFTITPKANARNLLKEISLVSPDLPEFWISAVVIDSKRYEPPHECQRVILDHGLEQYNTSCKAVVSFCSENYGFFDQHVAFDFGEEKNVERCIGISVCDETDLLNTLTHQPPPTNEDELTWVKKYNVIPFEPTENADEEEATYCLPPNIENCINWDAFDNLSKVITKKKYTFRQHLLLHVEEYDRRKELQRLSFQLDNIQDYVDSYIPGVTTHQTLKVPLDYCKIQKISRLIGRSGKALAKVGLEGKEVVYELRMVSFSTDIVIFELNSALDQLLSLDQGAHSASICFRFVDNFKFMHRAIDSINLDLIFPRHDVDIPSSWRAEVRKGLNTIQSRAVFHISDKSLRPPLLVLGPFGSGKTKTMAESIMVLLEQMACDYKKKGATDKKILLCTHSNSAADHYINDYIHGFLEEKRGDKRLRPLRINWEYRYSSAISRVVLSYSLVDQATGNFSTPSKEDLDNHSLIITTLVTASVLWDIGIKPGYFSHIMIDEAAQAMETETIIPLTLATPQTRIVLAGDHLQLNPPVISTLAREKLGLGTSLLERMFLDYPAESEAKIKFVENFRSWEDIVELASHIFYSNSLISHIKRPSTISYPIYFHGVRGKEEISKVTPSYLNSSEAAEIVSIVQNIKGKWDSSILGEFVDEKICVLASYLAQIQAIRKLLRKYDLGKVRVDTIQNVQGLEFDAVIISCVRTYVDVTIQDDKDGEDLGYLSNPKMLNTAITRAKYFCYFVGDPVALCKIGACKPCWKIILAKCERNNTFHYRLGFKRLMQLLDQEAEYSQQGTQGNTINTTEKTEEYDFDTPISDAALYGTEDITSPFSAHSAVHLASVSSAPIGKATMKDCVFIPNVLDVKSARDASPMSLGSSASLVVSHESRPFSLKGPRDNGSPTLSIVPAGPNAGNDFPIAKQESETLSKADSVISEEKGSWNVNATSNQEDRFAGDTIWSLLSAYQRYLTKYFEIALQASSTRSEQLNWKEKFRDLSNLIGRSSKTQSELVGVIDESFKRIMDELDSKVLLSPHSNISFCTKPSDFHRRIASRMDALEKARNELDAAEQSISPHKVNRNHVTAEICENLQDLSAYLTLCETMLHESKKLISRQSENSRPHQVLSLRLWMCEQTELDISQQIRGVNQRIMIISENNPRSKTSDFLSIPFPSQPVQGSQAPLVKKKTLPGFVDSDVTALHSENSGNLHRGTSHVPEIQSAFRTTRPPIPNSCPVQEHTSVSVGWNTPRVVTDQPVNVVRPVGYIPVQRAEYIPLQRVGNYCYQAPYPPPRQTIYSPSRVPVRNYCYQAPYPPPRQTIYSPSRVPVQVPYLTPNSTVSQSVYCPRTQLTARRPMRSELHFAGESMQQTKWNQYRHISAPGHTSARPVPLQATEQISLPQNRFRGEREGGETVESDAEVQAWFRDTGGDPFAQEYVLDSDRAKAAKLPSPKLFSPD